MIFADVPRKVLNPDHARLDIEPIEVRIREQLGAVITLDRLDTLGEVAQAMVKDSDKWQASLREARQHWIFNPGRSGDTAADYLQTLINQ